MTTFKSPADARAGRLVLLQQIVQEVSAAAVFPEALDIIVKRVREAMRTDVCSIYLTDNATHAHVLSATHGLNPAAVGQIRLAFDEGLVGRVATLSEPINLRNAASHPSFKLIPQCDEAPYHGFLGVPVIYRGDNLGVIVVQQTGMRRFRDNDVAFLVTLAAQLAGVIVLAKTGYGIGLPTSARAEQEYCVDAIAGAPGVAIGTGVAVYSPADLHAVPDRVPEDPSAEEAALRAAITEVVSELRSLEHSLEKTLRPEDRALFEALAMMVSGDSLLKTTVARIHDGNWAPGALRKTIDEYVSQFTSIEDPYLRERARDIYALGKRILAHLRQTEDTRQKYPEQTILVAEDLSPIDLAKVPINRLAGIISGHGSSLSHLSILARAMGIPAVVGTAGKLAANRLDARQLVIDGYLGKVYVNPSETVCQEFSSLVREEKAFSNELQHLRELPAETPDGFRVALHVNVGILADLDHSLTVGAEGVGLYRTELPFMLKEQFPGEEEQRVIYRQVLEAFAPKPVTLRTLDVGGDKTLPYFPIQESNPALGWRGVRLTLDNPVIFLTQFRAMIRAASGLDNLRIMIPMVGNMDEAEEAIRLLRRTYQELVEEGEHVTLPPCGLMVEVPSAVFQADVLARTSDFLSIGTNDLTQYLLAIDRSNERVAARFDSLHPAVIKALHHVVNEGHRQSKPVSVCGQAAGDPAMAILLLAMGIDSLSMSASDLPRIKSVIRTFSREHAQSLLNEVLQIDKAGLIRQRLSRALVEAGLGGLVHI